MPSCTAASGSRVLDSVRVSLALCIKCCRQFVADVLDEPRFADTANAGDGHKACALVVEDIGQSAADLFAVEKLSHFCRQVVQPASRKRRDKERPLKSPASMRAASFSRTRHPVRRRSSSQRISRTARTGPGLRRPGCPWPATASDGDGSPRAADPD